MKNTLRYLTRLLDCFVNSMTVFKLFCASTRNVSHHARELRARAERAAGEAGAEWGSVHCSVSLKTSAGSLLKASVSGCLPEVPTPEDGRISLVRAVLPALSCIPSHSCFKSITKKSLARVGLISVKNGSRQRISSQVFALGFIMRDWK